MQNYKIPRLEKWFYIELTHPVLFGQIYNKKGVPDGFGFYTNKLLGIHGSYAVCECEIFELGSPDKVWINTEDSERLEQYEFKIIYNS